MTLDVNNFKEVGSAANFADGGQIYSVFSDTDSLGTMMDDGYLDDLNDKLNSRDSVFLSGTDGNQVVQVTNTANVITVSSAANTGVATTLTGPGAIPVTNRSVDVTSTGADATTLADGAVGQLLNVTLIVDGGTMTMTPVSALGYSTIAFADAGDSVQLEFKSGGWAVVGQGGISTGPVVG